MEPATAMILGQVANLASQGFNIYQGIKDVRKGNQLEEQAGERPQYEVPDSLDKMIQMYQTMSNQGLPGQGQMERSIQDQTARSVSQAAQLADSPVAALTALNSAQQREAGALRDLQTRAAAYRAQAQQNYAQATGQRAQYEDQQWRQNQLLPWEINMNRAMQLQTQGRGNIMQGIGNTGAGAAQGATDWSRMQTYKGMEPNWGNDSYDYTPPQNNGYNQNYSG